MTKLLNLKKQLVEKYPDRAQRIEYITDFLITKLEHLRVYTLTVYITMLHKASREFSEFEQLIPSEHEIEELLKRS